MTRSKKALADQIMRLSNKMIFLEKKSIIKHGDLKLYPSEIHLINVIEDEKNINASKMAIRLGVTKGAVSQTLARLEKKGILYKTKDSQNKNELTVHFTPLGKDILRENRKAQTSLQKKYAKHFADISPEEEGIIMTFLTKMEKFFDSLA